MHEYTKFTSHIAIRPFAGAEIFVMKDVVGGEFPGDFRNGVLDFGWDTFDEDTKFVKRSIEVNQGRAAMSVSRS